MAMGQAMAWAVLLTHEVDPNTANVSPMTLTPIPVARRTQGVLRLPERMAVPPTASPSSRTSPIG